jgi:purine-binding chemotaxis protein CheW
MEQTRAGQYLACVAGNTGIAVPAEYVQEVYEARQLTRLPNCPSAVAGVINVRGTIVPVLGLWGAESDTGRGKSAVILRTPEGPVGLFVRTIVDLLRLERVSEARSLPAELEGCGREFRELGFGDGRPYYILRVEEAIGRTIESAAAREKPI